MGAVKVKEKTDRKVVAVIESMDTSDVNLSEKDEIEKLCAEFGIQ